MRTNSPKIKELTSLSLKTILIFIIFLTTFVYSIPVYNTVKAFFEEQLMMDTKIIVIGDTPVTIEIADTVTSRALGLSGRTELKEGRGMFFIFEKEDVYGFWMKDMNFAIDIIWFNSYGEVVFIKENATPESYPETFTPTTPALYALEVPTGFVKNHHIKLGDKIDLY